jgi:hypothetical protein
VVDHSIASATGLFNIATLDWDSDALAFAGITPERLSIPVPTIYRVEGLDAAPCSLRTVKGSPFYGLRIGVVAFHTGEMGEAVPG